jgi:hypothetical protein
LFDRDLPVQQLVIGLPHLAHPAPPQHPDQQIPLGDHPAVHAQRDTRKPVRLCGTAPVLSTASTSRHPVPDVRAAKRSFAARKSSLHVKRRNGVRWRPVPVEIAATRFDLGDRGVR